MNTLHELLIALGGLNKKSFKGCPDNEISKHFSYVTLLFIPASVGSVAMFFVAETLGIAGPAKYFMSIIWGVIVLIIDRALLITYHKRKEFQWKREGGFILIRLILATFIGILISHPLVLKLFEQSVNEKLQEKINTKIGIERDNIDRTKQIEIDKIYHILFVKDSIYKEYVYAANSESNGRMIEPTPLMHLTTSGKYGQKDHYKELIKGRNEAKKVCDSLVNKLATVEAFYNSLKKDVGDSIKIYKAKDTLAQIESLNELSQESPMVSTVLLLVLGFLVFLDITPLLVKLMSEYEVYEKRQEANQNYLQQECENKFSEQKSIIDKLYVKIRQWHENRINDIVDDDTIKNEKDLYRKLSEVFTADFSHIWNESSNVNQTEVGNSTVGGMLIILCVIIFLIMNLITPGEFINAIAAVWGSSAAGIVYIIKYKRNNKK